MITNGEFEIKMVVAVDKKSQVLPLAESAGSL